VVAVIKDERTAGARLPVNGRSSTAEARRARLGQYSAFAGLAVGAFMGPLDGSMVNSMLPVLTRELNAELATTEWLLTIYMLIQTGLMLSFGRLGARQNSAGGRSGCSR
jgi:MFS family permease